jgi:hypothetical protein
VGCFAGSRSGAIRPPERRDIWLDALTETDHPAERSRDLVCSINHAFCVGVVDGLAAASAVSADLDPMPGHCCVRLLGR